VKKLRRNLLATTALFTVTLAAFANGAVAAEKIGLSLGGYYHAYAVYGDQDDGAGQGGAGFRDHGLARESEVYFRGSSKLDNGVTYGVNIQLEGETSTDQIDESYIFVKGGFGHITVGSDDPASDSLSVSAPQVIQGVGLGDPDLVFSALPNSASNPDVITGISGDSDKLTYIAPRIAGIKFGMSYTPDNTEEMGGALRSQVTAGQQSDLLELGVNYERMLGKIKLALSFSYARGDLEIAAAGMDDQEQWGAGFSVSFSGFTVGGAYLEDDQGSSGSNTNRVAYHIGATYETGPWLVGVEYAHAEVEEGAGLGKDETDGVQIGGAYTLGPGVVLTGGMTWWDAEDNLNVAASENESMELIIGTLISF
jgi:predicted porin